MQKVTKFGARFENVFQYQAKGKEFVTKGTKTILRTEIFKPVGS
jgi:hypothetical protein